MKRKPSQRADQLILEPYESKILRRRLKVVPDPTAPEIQSIIANMLYSIAMPQLKKPAAGMAANQWGLDWQIFLYCPAGSENPDNIEVVINPSYKPIDEEKQEEDVAYEGCFSIPGAIQLVSRYTAISVRYQTPQGKWINRDLFGWEARVWQHENDHVLGVLCDAKAHRTLEKIVFASPEEEQAFLEGARTKRKKQ